MTTKDDDLEITREIKEFKRIVVELGELSLRVHAAADKAIRAIEGDENGA